MINCGPRRLIDVTHSRTDGWTEGLSLDIVGSLAVGAAAAVRLYFCNWAITINMSAMCLIIIEYVHEEERNVLKRKSLLADPPVSLLQTLNFLREKTRGRTRRSRK